MEATCSRAEIGSGLANEAYQSLADVLSLRQLNQAGRRAYIGLFFAEHILGPERFRRWLGAARTRNQARMQSYFANWPRDQRYPVREVSFSTCAEFYRTHRPSWEPAVFRGVARDWPAVQKWDLDFFATKYGDTRAILLDQHGLHGEGENPHYAHHVSTLAKLVAAIRAGERQCLRFSPLLDETPEMKQDLDMDWFHAFRGRLAVRGFPQLFIAPAATYTPVHCALESNAFLQVHGRKRWILHPAMYQPLLDPPPDRRPYFHTDFLPTRPSARYPLGEYAPSFEVILEPGDVMYVPPFVWHYVENLTDTVAVAYRFFSVHRALRSSWPLTLAKALSTQPPLLHTLTCPKRSATRRCQAPGCVFALPEPPR